MGRAEGAAVRLTAYLDGRRVGWFAQRDGGDVSLDLDPAWQHDAGRLELSLSLPKSRRRHEGTAPGNFLWNLLPDNGDVLARWRRTFGVSPRNPMGLRANVGRDAAGAVQLIDSDQWDEPEYDPLPRGSRPYDDRARTRTRSRFAGRETGRHAPPLPGGG